jgi:hypothetical protein
LIHGRVIGLGDRVELQRVYSGQEQMESNLAAPLTGASTKSQSLFGRYDRVLDEVLGRYQVQLAAGDRSALIQALKTADNINLMSLTGVMLNKLGLAQSPELLATLYATLTRAGPQGMLPNGFSELPELETVASRSADAHAGALRQLAEAIKRGVGQSESEPADDRAIAIDAWDTSDAQALTQGAIQTLDQPGADNDDAARRQALAAWLLNAQIDGMVSHRIGTIPLLINDRLIEVDVAFFEQKKDAEQKPEARHRQLVFSLRTEGLGRVEVIARISGEHVRVRIASDDGNATAALSQYAGALESNLASGGWAVDEVSYETKLGASLNGVARSVVEHVISQDSLNRLI